MRASRLCRLLAVCVAAAFLLGTTAPAAAADTVSVSIRPADEPTQFNLNVLPGHTAEREAVVSNLSTTPVDLLIYAADAATTAQGGFSLAERDAASRQLGSWIHLPVSKLHLAGRSRTTVRFRVAVPAGTTPGDYAGGILIQAASPGRSTDTSRDFAFKVDIVQRLGVRVYLQVAGIAQPGLKTGRLTWKERAGGLAFSLPVTNTGNIRLQPTAQLRVNGWNLPTDTIEMNRVDDLLPGATTIVTGQLTDPPRYAYGHASAHVDDGHGQHSTASTSLRLIPVLPTLGMLAAALILLLAGWRLVRFLRRARAALRELQHRPAWQPTEAPRPERRRRSHTPVSRLGQQPVTVTDITQSPYHWQLALADSSDSLTALANRSLFEEEVQFAINTCSSERLCLMLIDLDNFKKINDTLGRSVGDATLVAVAEVLRRAVRPQDLVARLDGDDFAVVFQDVAPADVNGIARRMLATLSKPLSIDGHQTRVTASLGVAQAQPADDARLLMRHATAALAAAKTDTKTHYAWYAAAST